MLGIASFAEIIACGVAFFDQSDFLCAGPALQLLFSLNCVSRTHESLEPDEPVAVVSCGESVWVQLFLVLVDAHAKVAGDADVKRVAATGHDVSEVGPLIHAGSVYQSWWMAL